MIKIQIADLVEGTLLPDAAQLPFIPGYVDTDVFVKMSKIVPILTELKKFCVSVFLAKVELSGGTGTYYNGQFTYEFPTQEETQTFENDVYNPLKQQYYYIDVAPLVLTSAVPAELQQRLLCLTQEA